MFKIRLTKLRIVASLVGLVLLFMIFKTATSGSPTVPRAVDVERAQRGLPALGGTEEHVELPAGDLIAGNGVVEPADRETKVAGEIAGRIAIVHAEEGRHVAAGDPLVELESDVERSALAAAEADLRVAQAELERTAKGLRAEDIDAAAAEAEAAVAKASMSEGTLGRVEQLAKTGAATADELDRARRQAAIDRQTATAAEARRRAALAGSRVEDVLVARARKAAAEARRDQAKAALDRRTVRSPIAGEVLAMKYRAGEFYAPGGADPLAIVGDTSKLRVRMDVDERDVARVKIGAAAFVTLNAFPGEKFEGKVVSIGRRMGRKNIRTDDPVERIDTKILEIVIELDRPNGLMPGLRVRSHIES